MKRLTALLVASAVTAGACGSSDGSDESKASNPASTAEPTTTAAPDEFAPVRARLAARYAHYDVVAYEGSGFNTMIISYGFTDLDDIDGELVAQESFCFSEQRLNVPITTEVSDEFTQAIKPVAIATTVTLNDDGTAHVRRDETPTALGRDLEDPANDVLPTDPNDPRIIDADGDGKPGVTVKITVTPELKGELYLARRERFAYDVDEQADGSLIGYVTDKSEQLLIGASDPTFAQQGDWVQHPDPANSPIILIPVERSWDCARLRTERPTLFPPTPSVDY